MKRKSRKSGQIIEADCKQTAEGFVVLKDSQMKLINSDSIPPSVKEARQKAKIDENGILQEESGNITKTFRETKTATGREILLTITDTTTNKDLQVTKQVYGQYGQLEKVYDMQVSATVPRVEYAYNLFGQVLTATYANGTTETNTYNAAGLTISTDNQTNVVSEYKYTYYYNGSQESKHETGIKTTYRYDGRGQLIEAKRSDGTVQKSLQTYTFDDNGNRLTMEETSENGSTVISTYTYDANDRLITETKDNLTTTYTYDANGNQLTKTASGSQTSQTHEFDTLNRMTRYHDGTTDISYRYYPDNMRKSKKVGNVTTTHIWFENEIALDMTANSVVNYIHGEKLIVSDYGWYHYNAHGDVVQLSGDNGTVTRDYDYDPYGNIIPSTSSTDENPYRYCGEYYDTETGFTYLRARYYDPNMGRFISEDPALDGLNWYIYCGNNPINRADPNGLWWKSVHQTLTENTFKKCKSKYSKVLGKAQNALQMLRAGSIYPDDKLKDDLRWHGFFGKKSVNVREETFRKAVGMWRMIHCLI